MGYTTPDAEQRLSIKEQGFAAQHTSRSSESFVSVPPVTIDKILAAANGFTVIFKENAEADLVATTYVVESIDWTVGPAKEILVIYHEAEDQTRANPTPPTQEEVNELWEDAGDEGITKFFKMFDKIYGTNYRLLYIPTQDEEEIDKFRETMEAFRVHALLHPTSIDGGPGEMLWILMK